MKKACLFACCALLGGVLLAQHSTPNAPLFQKGFPVPQAQPDASLPPQMDAGNDVDASDEPSDTSGGCSVHAAHLESKTAWLFLLGIATALRLRRPRKP